MTNVIVSRISLQSLAIVYRAMCRLCVLLRGNCRWSVELEETTCTLRMETEHLTPTQINELLKLAGFDGEAEHDTPAVLKAYADDIGINGMYDGGGHPEADRRYRNAASRVNDW